MGYYWSWGISFESKENAVQCQSEIKSIILKDGSNVNLSSSISLQTDYQVEPDYVLEIYPEQMEIDGKRNNLLQPNFNEIKDQLLHYLKNTNLNFQMAFFEFEGADRVTHENIIQEINEYGIGEILNADLNDLHMDKKNYVAKRYLDGLILSRRQYNKIKKSYPEFKNFKEGYFWLPI